MRLLTDEELFGMIPQADGTHIKGNATGSMQVPFEYAYLNAFTDRRAFPESIHTNYSTYSNDTNREKEKKREKAKKRTYADVYEKAMSRVDQTIEDHMEQSNGFIYSFPASKRTLYEKSEGHEYEYFKYVPENYIPPVEKKLHEAYTQIHDQCIKTFRWRLFWFLMATVALALVLLGGKLYALTPQLTAWAQEKQVNYYIYMGCLLLFLETVGYFVMTRRWELDFEEHTPVCLFMLGAIFAWGYIYFPGTVGEAPTEGVVKIIYHIIKWPYIAYFAVIWVFHLVYAITALSNLLFHLKHLKQYKKTFVQIYEEDANKLHRYVRLRQLWIDYEKVRGVYWLYDIESRLNRYQREYEALTKQQ